MRKMTLGKTIAMCAIATFAGGCALVPSAISDPLTGKIHVTAEFENIAGMYVSNEVSVLGMPIGTIESVESKGAYVEVKMSLDGDVKVPADAIAALVSPSVVTNRHVELTPVYTGDGPTLADGDRIPLDRTRTPVELDRVLASLDKIAGAMAGDGKGGGPVRDTIGVFDEALNGNGQKIQKAVEALAAAIKIGVDNKDGITNIITKLDELMRTLAENDQATRDFSNGITNLTKVLGDQAPGMQAVLAQLNDFLANTATVLANNKEQFGTAMTGLESVTNNLKASARQLNEVLDVTPLLFQNLDRATNRQTGQIRAHVLTNKILLDSELVNEFCERIQMKATGCRTGKIEDFGPDLGLTEAMLGLTK